jgi:autotransporter-associated beta strand protein
MKKWIAFFFCLTLCVTSNAQINVYWRDLFPGISNFWDSGNPWAYSSGGDRQRPDDNIGGFTRHNVFFENNSGNATINVNGTLFFNLLSFNIGSNATIPRTFSQTDVDGGISTWGGIFNNSTSPHIFDVRIAIDQNNAILGADAGALTFQREIFSNGRPFELRGNQPLTISGFISQAGGSVTKTGANTATLTGANTYTGLTTVSGGTFRLNRTGGTTIPVTNNITINGGNLQVSTNQTISNLTFTSGTLTVDAGVVLTITGTYTGGTGTIVNNGRIVMAGGAAQSFPGAATIITSMNELEINNASGVSMNSSLAITGSLILTNGTFNIGAGNLLDLNGASLVATGGFLNGSATSDITVRGTTGGAVTIPQNGNIALRNVSIDGTRYVAVNGINHINLTGAFTVGATATFDNGGESQLINGGGAPSITITGRFITKDAQGFTGTNTSVPGIAPLLNAGCTIEYGLLGNQAVSTRADYRNITFSGSGNKTIVSAFSPNGTVYITGAAVVQQSNNTFGDPTTNLTMDGGRLVMSGARPSPDMTGTYNLTGGVVEFAGASNQTIRGTSARPYQNVEVTGTGVANSSGNIELRSGGTFTVKSGGVFTINDDAITGPSGTQTVTVENNARFVCGDIHGFSGGTGTTATSVRLDVEVINLNTGSTIEYSRTTAQVFSTRNDYKNVTISGGGEKTLNGPVTISGIFTLTNGIVTTSAVNMLTMAAGSSVANTVYATRTSGGSDASFVNGPMRKIGNTDFIFPVGKPLMSNPNVGGHHLIAISAPANTTDEFEAEYYVANARLIGNITEVSLVNVSACEYWRLNRNTGSSSVDVTLSWNSRSNCNVSYVTNIVTLVAVHNTSASYTTSGYTNNSGVWDVYGKDSFTGTLTEGTVTWNNVATFSPFALGSLNQSENPLPFNLNYFNVTPNKKNILLNWTVGNNHEQQSYELERSKNGQQFEPISKIAAAKDVTVADYSYTDEQPLTGWNYYRLRATDNQLKQSTSRIVRVWWGTGPAVVSVLPNPASEKIVINLSDPSSITEIQIVNTIGQVMRNIKSVQFTNEVTISSLQAGMYYIRLLNRNGLITKTFIKQ